MAAGRGVLGRPGPRCSGCSTSRTVACRSRALGLGLLLGSTSWWPAPRRPYAFGSVQVRAPGSTCWWPPHRSTLAATLGVVTAVAVLRFRWDYARLGRVPSSSVYLASAAAIAVLLVGSKVLSVQYVIWLLPFAILLPRRMGWLLLAVTALSTAIYTTDYTAVWRLETAMIVALLIRNALLVVLAAWLVGELARRREIGRDVGRRGGGLAAVQAGEGHEIVRYVCTTAVRQLRAAGPPHRAATLSPADYPRAHGTLRARAARQGGRRDLVGAASWSTSLAVWALEAVVASGRFPITPRGRGLAVGFGIPAAPPRRSDRSCSMTCCSSSRPASSWWPAPRSG